MSSRRHFRTIVIGAIVCLAVAAAPAAAELVFLTSGRSLSVKAVTYQGDRATLELRAGGEIVCDRTLIARVESDEVPWPEPQTEAAVASAPTAAVVPPAAAVKPRDIPAEYRALVNRLSATHGVDARLVHAVITVESAYQPRARSPKGARGLMQLMPATARQYGVRNAYRPAANLEAGIKHLRSLLDRFDIRLALAAYNAGEAAVRRFGGVPPYRETQAYVARVLALAGPPSSPPAAAGQGGF
jgi:soluble lytic murein transglycosylase-like protein